MQRFATFSKGFTLMELMVSTAILLLVLLSLQAFLDQTQWLYTQTDRRANAQQNARVVMEQLERDIRMIGYGVPTGSQIGGTATWLPVLFYADEDEIRFRAAVENGTSLLTANAASANSSINVEDSSYYEEEVTNGPVSFVIVSDQSAWKGLICSSTTTGVLSLTTTLGSNFSADETEIHAIQHLFYRFISSGTYPFGKIESSIVYGNTPTTTAGTFETLGRNIVSLTFEYFDANGTALVGNPLTDTNSELVSMVEITLVGRERSTRPGRYQDFTLRSQVLIRNRNL